MKTRILTTVLGSLLAMAFVVTPVFAYHPHDGDGYGNYGYGNYGYDDYGYSDYGYGDDWSVDRDSSYGDYEDYGYRRPPYYGNDRSYGDDNYYDSGHSSGILGYWGKDARHHNRGHRHHHLF
ncbi:MAG: hypothetical protein ACRERD_25540 [Candidatus Binatia bacterium]